MNRDPILEALAADPNLAPAFKIGLSPEEKLEEAREAKREERRADARGEDLWRLRGGVDE